MKDNKMIDSRDIKDLHPIVASLAKTLIERAKNELGINLLITSTLRDNECQAKLYAKGRTTPGPKVTNAKPGQSFHNYGVAFDVVPVIDGKAIWSTSGKALEIWQSIGKLGKEIGLEWAGDWKTFKEFPHFQYVGGLTLKDFQAGKRLP